VIQFRFFILIFGILSGTPALECRGEENLSVPDPSLLDQYLMATSGTCPDEIKPAIAFENRRLMDELEWAISERLQKGWSIYYPLISEFLGTSAKPDSLGFAEAVSRWQLYSGCRNPADGLLEGSTLLSIFLELQSRRFNKAGKIGLEKKMVVVEEKYIFDRQRAKDRRQLGQETFNAYEKMIIAARKSGIKGDYLKIISGYRSVPYQDELRARMPNLQPNQLATQSVHSTGRAIDLYVGGDPVNSNVLNRKNQTDSPAYRWLLKNARSFGFVPYYFEPWHWEYVGTD